MLRSITMAALLLGCTATDVDMIDEELPVPTVSDPNPGCRGVGFSPPARLAGDPSDPRLAWLEFSIEGRREVVWPAGYRARFAAIGEIEILTSGGQVMLREGDLIRGGCVTPDPNTWLLVPTLE